MAPNLTSHFLCKTNKKKPITTTIDRMKMVVAEGCEKQYNRDSCVEQIPTSSSCLDLAGHRQHENKLSSKLEQNKNEQEEKKQDNNESDTQLYVYKSVNEILKPYGYNSWVILVVRRFLRVLFTQSIPIYLPIHTIPLILFKRRLLREKPRETLLTLVKNIGNSCMFLSSFQTLFAAGICVSNILFKRDSPALLASSALIASSAVLFENASRRKEMTLYSVPRVYEILQCYCAESKWSKDIRQIVPILFSLSMGIIMYLYHRDPTGRSIKQSLRFIISHIVGY